MIENVITSVHGVVAVQVGEAHQLQGGQWVREMRIETADGEVLRFNLFGDAAPEVQHG